MWKEANKGAQVDKEKLEYAGEALLLVFQLPMFHAHLISPSSQSTVYFPILNILKKKFRCGVKKSWGFFCRQIFAFDADSKRLKVMQRLMKVAGVECVTTTNCSFLEASIIKCMR